VFWSESNAPALIRHSITRRLTSRRSTRPQKSSRLVKVPSASRTFTMESMAVAPTFLIAASPKWIASPDTVN